MGLREKLAECEGFRWDAGNAVKNWDSHHVTPAECEQIFFNHPLLMGSDEKQSADEERYYALGRSDNDRLMFVVFTIHDRLIRVISACGMKRKERRIFESS